MRGVNTDGDLYYNFTRALYEESMTKKQKLRKKRNKKENSDPKADHVLKEDEKPFDFGGIPPRDLKKNLGCG